MIPEPLAPTGALVGLVALLLVLGAADTAHAQTFDPSFEITVIDPRPQASSDVQIDFNLAEGDVNFAGFVAFIPNDWGIVRGEDIPIGAIVGKLTSTATLGIINGACNNQLPVVFNMQNASLDINDTVDFEDSDDSLKDDFAEDNTGDGLLDAVDKYPDFINRVLTDEDDTPLQPIRRSAGITVVAGVDVLLQFLVFEPGTFVSENIPTDPDLGFPTVVLLQNAGDPEPEPVPGAITDFCTPLISTNTFFGISKDNGCTDATAERLDPICDATGVVVVEEGGTEPDESGVVLNRNPDAGDYTFTYVALGQRDADGDGFENSLDTCPLVANIGDARISGDGDADGDGLDAACDPNDQVTNSDEDLDGYLNRQDNCPLVANGEEDADNQEDNDLDAFGNDSSDQIGDACDPNPLTSDTEGELAIVRLTQDITISGEPVDVPDDEEPTGGTPDSGDDDGGGSALIIIIVVIAAAVVLGGGAFALMRRKGGGA